MQGLPTTQREIDLTTARAKMERFLASRPPLYENDRWVIVGSGDHEGFWLFWWHSVRLVEQKQRTGWAPGIAGNNPIAVRKDDGSMYMWSLLCSFEEFEDCIRRKDYERHAYPLERAHPEDRNSQ
ncbi:MAG: hypothetical protein L0241_10755 [Planctomycetia bacterium]|nr:hypothetical protein [Planctomycetia bacterium]